MVNKTIGEKMKDIIKFAKQGLKVGLLGSIFSNTGNSNTQQAISNATKHLPKIGKIIGINAVLKPLKKLKI